MQNESCETASYITPFFGRGLDIYGAAYDKNLSICKTSLRDSAKAYFRNRDPAQLFQKELTNTEIVEKPGVFLGHCFSKSSHYGHFLLETLPMLSEIIRGNVNGCSYIFLRWGSTPDRAMVDYVLDAVGLSELKNDVIVCGNSVLEGSFTIVKRPIAINDTIKDIEPYRLVIDALKNAADSVVNQIDIGEKIFLCRKIDRVDPVFAQRVQQLLMARGFIPIYPEKFSFIEQVSIMKKARFIAGFEGSNLHNSIFSSTGAITIEFGSGRSPLTPNQNQKLCSIISGTKLEFVTHMTSTLNQDVDSILNG
jgi:capsular polysaccharide biosynthesis protein